MDKTSLYENILTNIRKSLSEMASREDIGDFDELDAFDDEYIKVKRNNTYNLIDADGRYLSDRWFQNIKKTDKNNIETSYIDKDNVTITHTYQDIKNLKKENQIMDMVDNSDFLKYIKVSDIQIISPFILDTDNGTVKIVAEVRYNNIDYYIGKDGQLYDKNVQKKVSADKMAGGRLLDIINRISAKVYSRFDCNEKYKCSDDKYMFWMHAENLNTGNEACSLDQDSNISNLSNYDRFTLNVDTYLIDLIDKNIFKKWLVDTLDFNEDFKINRYKRVRFIYGRSQNEMFIHQMMDDLAKIENFIDMQTSKKPLNEMAATKAQIGDFDNIYPFSSVYMKVQRGSKYNLIDSRNGQYMSKVWFDGISKNMDGSIVAQKKKSDGKVETETYKDLCTFCAAPIIMQASANQDVIRKIINIVKIDNVTECDMVFDTVNNGTVQIIAKVKYNGMILLMDETGKLYKEDGTEFILAAAYINQNYMTYQIATYDELTDALFNNIVEFIFTKVDGTYRVAFGTLRHVLITEEKPNGYRNTLQFFDVVKNAWRSISKKADVHADVVIVKLFNDLHEIDPYIDDTEKVIDDYKRLIKLKEQETHDEIITTNVSETKITGNNSSSGINNTNNSGVSNNTGNTPAMPTAQTSANDIEVSQKILDVINSDKPLALFIEMCNINYDAISFIGNTVYINLSAGDITMSAGQLRNVVSKSQYNIQFINKTPYVGGVTILSNKMNENISQILPLLNSFKNAQMDFLTFNGFRITKSLEDILAAVYVNKVDSVNSHMWFRRNDKIQKDKFKNKSVDISGIDKTIYEYIEK